MSVPVSITNWANTTLCDYQDLLLKVSILAKILTDERATNLITDIKEEIARKCRVEVYNRIQSYHGIDYTRSDFPTELCDMIGNPQSLKQSCIYGVLATLFRDRTSSLSKTDEDKWHDYQNSYVQSLREALVGLSVDINLSGTITGGETHNKFRTFTPER